MIRWLREVRAARGARLGLREKGVNARRNDGVVDGRGRERRVGEGRGRESDGLTEEQGFAGGGEGRVPAAAMTAAGCKGVRMHS